MKYTISSDFEGGNLQVVSEKSADHFAGNAQCKLSEPRPMWYYFRIDGPPLGSVVNPGTGSG